MGLCLKYYSKLATSLKTSVDIVILVGILQIVSIPNSVAGGHCFGSGVNEIPGQCGEDGLKCPWYRNLARQVPLAEGCPVSDLHFRKFGNCIDDKDCCTGSYCCLAICQGVTRCYNPYINKFTDNLHDFTGNPACPVTQAPCALNITTTLAPTTTTIATTTTTTTTTTTPKTTTTTTTKPTTTTTTTKPITTTTANPTTTTTTTTPKPITTTTSNPTTTTTTTTPKPIITTTVNPTTILTTLPTTIVTTTLATTSEPSTTPPTTTTTTEDPRGSDDDYNEEPQEKPSQGAGFIKEEGTG